VARSSTSRWSYFRDLDKYRGAVKAAVLRMTTKIGTKGIERAAFVQVIQPQGWGWLGFRFSTAGGK
jgi:hypothetical protein